MTRTESGTGLRMAELLAVLSLGSDLGMGQPMSHAMRQCVIALRLGERLGLGAAERADLYYAALIAWVGCHIDAYEQAKWFGDDLALKVDYRRTDMTPWATLTFTAAHLGAGRSPFERAGLGVKFVAGGHRDVDAMLENHCLAVDSLAGKLGLDDDVRATLRQTFERWDGKGAPDAVKGADIKLAAQIIALADVVAVYHREAGVDAAVVMAQQRSGTQFGPDIVTAFADAAAEIVSDLDAVTSWEAVIAAEPALGRVLSDEEAETALEAVADFVDLKSPFTLGHSRAVADLSAAAAGELNLGRTEVTHVRRAALVHDLGRLGVSNAVWDKQGELTASEAERVRLHPYLTDRMLSSSPWLAPLGATAVQHHERLDGSGYPRGLRGAALTGAGRTLAAADAYQAKLEPRPHRPALPPPDAARWLRSEVRAGRFDGDTAEAVLRAAGHRPRRAVRTAGLTEREVEVLRLLARGHSSKQIAAELVISPKTVNHHVEHIYDKIGVSNRARASLFAVNHGLMG